MTENEIFFIQGVTDGLSLACQAAGKPGDNVLMQTPVYTPFFRAPEKVGQTANPMELSRAEDGCYFVDNDRFKETPITTHQLETL